ncbi:thioredoxin-T [Drosophila biarmipes]|uniref:thioredoxin-T n=1 Tax=Drosophila biarmipes TaxID=125945 RepID=UPI0007E65DDE|nr:thioredoxin-T [Drosophila biarmipes]XP_016962081.1 thioredoxin-T [Drosophila biarmipes]
MVYLVRNKEDLDQQLVLAEDKLVVIDFYANWCGPCKIIAPKLEELAQQYSDRAVVLKVDVDDNEEITVEYNVTSMPTFVFIKGGEVLELFVGCNSDKLAKSMEKFAEPVADAEATGQRRSSSHLAGAAMESEDACSAGPSASSSGSVNEDVIRELSEHDQEAVLEH